MNTTITMYSTGTCSYCVRAEAFLKNNGVTAIEKIRIDLSPEKRDEMMKRTQRKTVPQIFIGELHIGGYDDLFKFDQAGKLAPLLKKYR